MTTYERLLTHGYLPRELPPFFHTQGLAPAIKSFASANGVIPTVGQKSRTGSHNLAQAGTLRRKLGYHNPATAHHIASIIDAEWSTIAAHLAKASAAYSSPVVGKGTAVDARALVPSRDFGQMPAGRAHARAAGRYLLCADISRFYASVYTHSIPWALQSKAWAKQNKSGGCGNDLDRAFRNGQDGQTLGIPIGPDCSYLVAECILAAVDARFEMANGPVHGVRFLDDYEMAFASYAEAQTAMGHLQEALAEYELALNPVKTKIIDLPHRIEFEWVSELRGFEFRSSGKGQRTDFLHYFDRAYELAAASPDAHVLNYALARIAGEPVDPANWGIVQHLTFQALLGEPKTFRPALQLLQDKKSAGNALDSALLAEVLNRQILIHGPLGHSSELAWALWTARVHSAPINPLAVQELSRQTDPVIALLSLDCESAGLIPPNTLDHSLWLPLMETPELTGAHWLLAYEASIKGWLPSVGGGDHISPNPFFSALRSAGVSFYDTNRVSVAAPHIPSPAFTGGGGGGMSGF